MDEEGADAEASDVEGNEGAHAGERAHPTIDELKEEVIEEEVEEVTVMGRVSEGLRSASENPGLRNLGGLGFFFLASTFAYSCYKVFRKATSGRARRKRTVNKNVEVVERLKHFFPHERNSLNRGVVKGLSLKTGYTSAEIFRKYLRYKLTEEPFTLDFVADVLALTARATAPTAVAWPTPSPGSVEPPGSSASIGVAFSSSTTEITWDGDGRSPHTLGNPRQIGANRASDSRQTGTTSLYPNDHRWCL